MKNPIKFKFLTFLLFSFSFFVFSSCSDSSTGLDDDMGTPPQIPESVPVEIDTDYFNDNAPEFSEETAAFYEALGTVQAASLTLFSGSLLGAAFLDLAVGEDATFENGIWEWVYTFEQGSESVTVRITAQSAANGYNWNVYLSGDYTQLGQNLDEFLLLSGTVSSEGELGSWNFYAPDSETPLLNYAWTILSETEYEAEYTFNDPDEGTEAVISYERDGDENFVIISADDLDSDIEVYWNTSTLTGYIISDGVKTCWDSNFVETACS